jgi:hypothetical protein
MRQKELCDLQSIGHGRTGKDAISISEARREAPGLLGSNQDKGRYRSAIEGTTRMLFPALGLT